LVAAASRSASAFLLCLQWLGLAQAQPSSEVGFSRILHGWTNYSTAFLATQDTGSTNGFATVASFYSPPCDVVPLEYAAIFIWNGPTDQQVDFTHDDFQVYFWSSLAAFTNCPTHGDLATFTFAEPTGGSETQPDAITVGGRPAWLLRFALTNQTLVLSNHHEYLVGVAARTDSAQFSDLFIPTSKSSGPSDVQAASTLVGGWRYLVDAGGLTTYSGELATELMVRRTDDRPRLDIRLANGSLEVSWPASAECYVLQAGEAVPVTNWTAVAVLPTSHDGWIHMTLPVSEPAQYFRLRK
jgi:hypothetical protein